MASIPIALSVHNLVSSVGADAGFAAVVGLAILALLYFAHARETANLREEAAGLAQRLAYAEAQLAAAQRAQPAVAPAPAVVTDDHPVVPMQGVFAPAGLGAPALASATRFLPAGLGAAEAAAIPAARIKISRVAGAPASAGPPGVVVPPASPAGSPAPAGPQPAPAPDGSPASTPGQPPAQPEPQSEPTGPLAPAPAPAAVAAFRTAPATVAGAAGERTATGDSNGSSAPAEAEDRTSASQPPPQPPAPPVRAQPPARPPDRDMFVSSRSRARSPVGRRFAVLLGVLVAVGAVAAVIILTSGTGPQNPPVQAGNGNGNATPAPIKPAFDPALVTVAVLNGTNTNQLAHHVADRLAAKGFKEGQIATASNQTLTSTIVGYLPGAANQTDAVHVAKILKLPSKAVVPVDAAARAVACPPPATCPANVVVTVGSNLAAGY